MLFEFSAADSVLFIHDRETLSEAESEPIKLSSLGFGDENTETSSTQATSLVTPFGRTTTPRELTPTGLEESSEEGDL